MQTVLSVVVTLFQQTRSKLIPRKHPSRSASKRWMRFERRRRRNPRVNNHHLLQKTTPSNPQGSCERLLWWQNPARRKACTTLQVRRQGSSERRRPSSRQPSKPSPLLQLQTSVGFKWKPWRRSAGRRRPGWKLSKQKRRKPIRAAMARAPPEKILARCLSRKPPLWVRNPV